MSEEITTEETPLPALSIAEKLALDIELTLEEKVHYIFGAIRKAETELLPALNGLAQGPLGGMLGGFFR